MSARIVYGVIRGGDVMVPEFESLEDAVSYATCVQPPGHVVVMEYEDEDGDTYVAPVAS